VELDLDAAVLVGPDFLAGLADHDRRLRSVDHGPRMDGRRAVGESVADRVQAAHHFEFLAAAARIRAAADLVLGAGDQVFAVLVFARVAVEGEQAAREQAAGIGHRRDLLGLAMQALQAPLGQNITLRALRVAARVIVDFVVRLPEAGFDLRGRAPPPPLVLALDFS